MTTLVGLPQVKEAQIKGLDPVLGFTLTRQQFVDVIDDVLETMGAHFHSHEREALREFAKTAKRVSFGSWARMPGCPLQQTHLCDGASRSNSVFDLFTEHFDSAMAQQYDLGSLSEGVVEIV